MAKDLESVRSNRSITDLIRSPSTRDLQIFQTAIQFYMSENYWSVATVLCSVYIFLQAFAIPGPAIIALLMAALFGGWLGGAMSLACALIGSSICYFMFRFLGRPVLDRYFSQGLERLKSTMAENNGNIFYYFVFLRVTPILPNWFINISSGNVGIGYPTFFFGSLIGLVPNAIILAKAGVEFASFGKAEGFGSFDLQRGLGLAAIGLLALLPVLIKNRFYDKKPHA